MFNILWYFLIGPGIDGFEQHLIEAIEVNTRRSAIYGAKTDGATDSLFNSLITGEYMIRPVARAIDAMAVGFVADGVPVVVDDFVSMDNNRAVDTPIKTVSVMEAGDLEAAGAIIDTLLEETDTLDGFDVVDASAAALEELEALEEAEGVYFAMSRHVIESQGLAALHGLYYNCQTNGETAYLVDTLVGTQRLGLLVFDVTDYDAQANVFHRDGIGVLVNDLPVIPFLAEYAVFESEDRARLEACLR